MWGHRGRHTNQWDLANKKANVKANAVKDNAKRLVQTPHKIPQPHDESDVFDKVEKIIEEKIKEKENYPEQKTARRQLEDHKLDLAVARWVGVLVVAALANTPKPGKKTWSVLHDKVESGYKL